MHEQVDSTSVTQYAGVFSGTFDVEDSDAGDLRYDREVTLVVTARVRAPRFKETKEGDLVRVNVLGVREVAVVKDEQFRSEILGRLNLQELAPTLFTTLSDWEADLRHREEHEVVAEQTLDGTEEPQPYVGDEPEEEEEEEDESEYVFSPGASPGPLADPPSWAGAGSQDPVLARFLAEGP